MGSAYGCERGTLSSRATTNKAAERNAASGASHQTRIALRERMAAQQIHPYAPPMELLPTCA